ncbi:hypothetical protein CA850_10075 [Micromonospora echinospora]|nr:hypothetical protein CA850_10075 [Micromonospora echinospora]
MSGDADPNRPGREHGGDARDRGLVVLEPSVAVALRFGERPEVAYVLPLPVDGMLVVASTAMMESGCCGMPQTAANGLRRFGPGTQVIRDTRGRHTDGER